MIICLDIRDEPYEVEDWRLSGQANAKVTTTQNMHSSQVSLPVLKYIQLSTSSSLQRYVVEVRLATEIKRRDVKKPEVIHHPIWRVTEIKRFQVQPSISK
jgi:hypothetical protein